MILLTHVNYFLVLVIYYLPVLCTYSFMPSGLRLVPWSHGEEAQKKNWSQQNVYRRGERTGVRANSKLFFRQALRFTQSLSHFGNLVWLAANKECNVTAFGAANLRIHRRIFEDSKPKNGYWRLEKKSFFLKQKKMFFLMPTLINRRGLLFCFIKTTKSTAA